MLQKDLSQQNIYTMFQLHSLHQMCFLHQCISSISSTSLQVHCTRLWPYVVVAYSYTAPYLSCQFSSVMWVLSTLTCPVHLDVRCSGRYVCSLLLGAQCCHPWLEPTIPGDNGGSVDGAPGVGRGHHCGCSGDQCLVYTEVLPLATHSAVQHHGRNHRPTYGGMGEWVAMATMSVTLCVCMCHV